MGGRLRPRHEGGRSRFHARGQKRKQISRSRSHAPSQSVDGTVTHHLRAGGGSAPGAGGVGDTGGDGCAEGVSVGDGAGPVGVGTGAVGVGDGDGGGVIVGLGDGAAGAAISDIIVRNTSEDRGLLRHCQTPCGQ